MALRRVQYAVFAAACATALLRGLGLAGCAHPALPGLVFACAVTLCAWRHGLLPGALSALLSIAGLLYLLRAGGQPFSSALLPRRSTRRTWTCAASSTACAGRRGAEGGRRNRPRR